MTRIASYLRNPQAQYCIIMPQNKILRLNQWFLKSDALRKQKICATICFTDADSSSHPCGCSSSVERQLPKLNVVGSIPITRSNKKELL